MSISTTIPGYPARLANRGGFIFRLEREHRRGRLHSLAARHRKLRQLARLRRGEINEFALDVALVGIWRPLRTARACDAKDESARAPARSG